ncbi:MAG: hypothetical protein KDC80_11375, partial [Saprospiraceae bacterium]|nr:hypothetical protein [Saprospiraceae bacterium]
MDESTPAGRITERLVSAIEGASFCIADITGHKPNVMWEVGYAMALKKSVIIICQGQDQTPFDIKDMHRIQYDTQDLYSTLQVHLKKSIEDTLSEIKPASETKAQKNYSEYFEPFSRQFANWEFEDEFRRHHVNNNLSGIRAYIVLGIILYLLYIFLDWGLLKNLDKINYFEVIL